MDFRPGYRELTVPSGLRDAIACVWVRVVSGAPARVLPDACVDLIWQAGRRTFVAGPDTGPAQVTMEPGSLLVGARFLPGAGGAALGLPLSALRDLRVPLSELSPRLAERLPPDLPPQEAVRRIGTVAAGLAIARPPDPAIRRAARRLADPRTRVDSLARELGLSERQLRRRCDAAVGYGPKSLQSTLRFQRFVGDLDAEGPAADLARLAFEAGFSDQSHLTRECTRLAGIPPAQLARERRGTTPAMA